MIPRMIRLAILLTLVQIPISPALAQDALLQPEIKVLEQGSEPRIAIRMHPDEGQEEVVSMTMNDAHMW